LIVSKPTVSGRFLAGSGGPLAAVVWEPPKDIAPRFAVLYLPPFGDEMNKSRRMAALQARALAGIGGTVALLDPRGTGDSGGDHGAATWEGWQADIVLAWQWLAQRSSAPCILWGLRMGALLAAAAVAKGPSVPAALILWQPIASGRAFFNQYLRLATIQQRMGSGENGADAKALRLALAAGNAIEVAGYELNPSLVAAAEAIDLAELDGARCPVIWREVSADAAPAISPATAKIASRWLERGTELDVAAVSGPSFWASQEIAEAPQLIAATTAAVAARLANQARLAP
jgi:exosortase A-associated hydrolase 2